MKEEELLSFARNAPVRTDGLFWKVTSCQHAQLVVVAVFSQQEFAQLLVTYLNNADPSNFEYTDKSTATPFEGNVSERPAEIDKYIPELKAGKKPFEIKMEMNGRLFSAERAATLYESLITQIYYAERTEKSAIQRKSKMVYAIFWANDKSEAIKLAEEHIINLNGLGAFD